MSTLLLSLLACSPEPQIRRFDVTATYGSFEIVSMDGTSAGTLHGYHVDGQFGLPTVAVHLGDTIEITLHNETVEPMGLHPHGVHYDKANDGVERVAAPGDSITYTWQATEGAGTFLYHSHQMDAMMYEYQAEAGILGALVVLDPREAAPDSMVTYLLMAAYEPWTEAATGPRAPVEEKESSGAETNESRRSRRSGPSTPRGTTASSCPSSADIVVVADEQRDHAIPRQTGLGAGSHTGGDTGDTSSGHHGGSGGSTLGTHNHTLVVQSVSGPGWTQTTTHESAISQARLGDTLRVNVVSFGTEFHTFHLHGHTWTDPGTGLTTDAVTVGPGTAYAFVLDPLDNPGSWNVHCHVEAHHHSMSGWLDVE